MIKLELNIDELNLVFGALAKAPYESVFAIIDNIRNQAVPQLQRQAPQDAAEN